MNVCAAWGRMDGMDRMDGMGGMGGMDRINGMTGSAVISGEMWPVSLYFGSSG